MEEARITLLPYVLCIQFTWKGLNLFLALGSSQLRGRKIVAPCKLSSLGNPSTRDKPDKNGGGTFSRLSRK